MVLHIYKYRIDNNLLFINFVNDNIKHLTDVTFM